MLFVRLICAHPNILHLILKQVFSELMQQLTLSWYMLSFKSRLPKLSEVLSQALRDSV